MFVLCSPGAQEEMKRELLLAVLGEADASIRRLLCDTIAELGMVVLEGGSWPQLMPFLHGCVSSEAPVAFEAGLLMFEYLSGHVAEAMEGHMGELYDMCVARAVGSGCSRMPSPSPGMPPRSVVRARCTCRCARGRPFATARGTHACPRRWP